MSLPDDLLNDVDDYLGGTLDEARLRQLEARLRDDAEARRQFVRYCRMHTDLHLEARAQQAGQRALEAIARLDDARAPAAPPARRRVGLRWVLATAAALLAALGVWWWSGQRREAPEPREEVAWLINAQDCVWVGNQVPAGDMRGGKVLRLQRGLVEIQFQSGARVVLEGPASLELLTGNSARLQEGKLTARVPTSAKGFQVTSPQGKVVDLGTEFGMAVARDGTTDVYVFAGQVEAHAAGQGAKSGMVSVQAKQAARIDAKGVALQPAEQGQDINQFVRAIPQFVPRTLTLDFRQAVPGSLLDAAGLGTGLTHRLPGTGKKLLAQDRYLQLDPVEGLLLLTTTNTDLNTSFRLDWGEYLGIRLADLGFTGREDFALTVVVPDIPELRRVGQFGLYAGPHSKKNIRGGMIGTDEPSQYKQFLVLNCDGKDTQFHHVGVGFAGDDLRLTLQRQNKKYALTVENQTAGSSTSITMQQPDFLENESDLYVGFFGANTQSKEQRTLKLKEFQVTVWTAAPS
jgi:hypothetical protein